MRFLMRSPILLILFTIFSLLSFGVTAIAQETGLPVVQGTYQSASSPAKRALEEAKAAKEAAENEKNEAQVALEAATEALNIAEQQLQAAQVAADAEDQALQVAQAEVDEAQQTVDAAMSELNEAQAALDALNQQLAEAQNKVDEASTVKASAEQALQAALAEISRITGLPVVGGNYGSSPIPPVDGTYSGPPGGGGNNTGSPGTGEFETILPIVTSALCGGKVNPNDSLEEIVGDPEGLFICDTPGPLNIEFKLPEKMLIKTLNVALDLASGPIFNSPHNIEIMIDGQRVHQGVINDRTFAIDIPGGPIEGTTISYIQSFVDTNNDNRVSGGSINEFSVIAAR